MKFLLLLLLLLLHVCMGRFPSVTSNKLATLIRVQLAGNADYDPTTQRVLPPQRWRGGKGYER
jgi:hypothetical protein